MEAFYRTHAYLVEHTNAPVRRTLMDEIDWNDRLIGIKGTRGVGKTTFLLQYAKEKFSKDDRKCLYINMNNFFFQGRGIADFAGDFVSQGGRVLLIDQVFKEPDWSCQLRACYDLYPELKIVFPALEDISISRNVFCNVQTGVRDTTEVALVHFTRAIPQSEREKLREYLRARLKARHVELINI